MPWCVVKQKIVIYVLPEAMIITNLRLTDVYNNLFHFCFIVTAFSSYDFFLSFDNTSFTKHDQPLSYYLHFSSLSACSPILLTFSWTFVTFLYVREITKSRRYVQNLTWLARVFLFIFFISSMHCLLLSTIGLIFLNYLVYLLEAIGLINCTYHH